MKSQEQLHKEAEEVLEAVGEKIKKESKDALSADDISALSSLVDSYSRLFELVK